MLTNEKKARMQERLKNTIPIETPGAWYHEDVPMLLRALSIAEKTCPNGGNDGYITPRPCQCEAENRSNSKYCFCPECGCNEFSFVEYNNEKICKGCGQSYFDDIDYSDIVGKHLREAVLRIKALERVKAYWDGFYGQGLEIANWHMNGTTESFDNFWESAEAETIKYLNETVGDLF